MGVRLIDLFVSAEWMDHAQCAKSGLPVDAAFPETSVVKRRIMLDMCAVCPVRIDCLEYALENNLTEGIWGYTTPEQRKGMRRSRAA